MLRVLHSTEIYTMIKKTKTQYHPNFAFHDTDEVIGRSLDLYGEYSQLELDFLLGLLDQTKVVYDIGSNIGYHATAFASRVKKVYGFEPNPRNYSLLVKNTEIFSNIQLMNCAVGSKFGMIKCCDYDPDIPGNYGNMKVGVAEATITVPVMSIDDLGLEKPDLIKIDVEGSEYQVFKGCMNTIETHKPLLYYEAHETLNFKEIYEMLEPHGYIFYWAQVNNYNPNNFAKNNLNVFSNTALFSVFAVPSTFQALSLSKVLDSNDNFEKLISRSWNKI